MTSLLESGLVSVVVVKNFTPPPKRSILRIDFIIQEMSAWVDTNEA